MTMTSDTLSDQTGRPPINTLCPKIGAAQWTCKYNECTCYLKEKIPPLYLEYLAISVTFLTLGTGQEYTEQFNDWYAFADYLKQREERGNETLIRGWKYVRD